MLKWLCVIGAVAIKLIIGKISDALGHAQAEIYSE